jgi:hypothetical protein
MAEAAEHPLVKAALATFPGATITDVRELGTPVPDPLAADPVASDPLVPAPEIIGEIVAEDMFVPEDGPSSDPDDPGPFGGYAGDDGEGPDFDD